MASDPGLFGDLLHCMICFEQYNNPKMLKCAHTFCADCLQGYFTTYQTQKRAVPGKIPCPTCRELTTLPPSGISGLRNDFKVQKIEEMFKTMNIRDRANSRNCDSCKAQKKTSRAKVYCAGCSMNYCEPCLKKHNKNPLFKGHQVLDKATENSSDFFCKVHTGENGRFFCRTCEMVVCTLCIMHEHEGHNVSEIDDVFRQHQQDIANLQNIVVSTMEHLKQRSVDLETVRQLNLNSCQEAELVIRERTQQLVSSIKQQEKELLQELRVKQNARMEAIMKEIDRVNAQLGRAHQVQDFAKNSTSRNSLQLMAVHEELIQRMRTIATADTAEGEADPFVVVGYIPGRQEVNLGRINEVQGSAEELSRNAPSSEQLRMIRQRIPRSLSHVESRARKQPLIVVNNHRYGTGKGELRDPLGVACLLNGDIVVSEWGNKRVQIFNSAGRHVSVVGVGKIGPQGVAVTLRGNIIVTDGEHKRLQVFSPSGSSLSIWGLGRFFGPCGLAVCPNGNCLVTDIAENCVSIYKGEKTCVARFGTKGKADNQFDHPLYVTSGQHNEIIVSDSNNHYIKIFDSKGRFIRKFGGEGTEDGKLKFPRGVCTDERGNILVADRNNHRICLFTHNGRFIRNVLTKEHGIQDPYGIAMSMAGNLVITESAENRAALKMFQL